MIRARTFDRERDLAPVLELVGASRARGEHGSLLHPGGLQWWLRRIGRRGFDVAVLCDGEAIVGFALRDESDVIVQTDDAHAADLGDLLAWIEARAREPEIFVSVAEDDMRLRDAVAARDYTPSERYGYELVREVAAEPAAPRLPAGFTMISLTPALADRFVDLHRAAWSRPNAPSPQNRQLHDLVVAMPDFRYDLVPIAVGGRRSRRVLHELVGSPVAVRRD